MIHPVRWSSEDRQLRWILRRLYSVWIEGHLIEPVQPDDPDEGSWCIQRLQIAAGAQVDKIFLGSLSPMEYAHESDFEDYLSQFEAMASTLCWSEGFSSLWQTEMQSFDMCVMLPG